MEYFVKIDAFEGPLDLLLHLINRLEIDIYDIPMAEITEQYLLYIDAMKELELDEVSEYLVMAATLLAIKSKTLLPTSYAENEHEDEFFEEDPRDELVEQLIEYKKYKEAAKGLKNREVNRGMIYTKPPIDFSPYIEQTVASEIDMNVSIDDLLGALNKLLRRKKLRKPVTRKILNENLSIDDKMTDILTKLDIGQNKVNFNDFFPYEDKKQIVITFLAMLELMKRNQLTVQQDQLFGDIYLSRT